MQYYLKVEDLQIEDVRNIEPSKRIYVKINGAGIDLRGTTQKLGNSSGIDGILIDGSSWWFEYPDPMLDGNAQGLIKIEVKGPTYTNYVAETLVRTNHSTMVLRDGLRFPVITLGRNDYVFLGPKLPKIQGQSYWVSVVSEIQKFLEERSDK